MVMEDKINNNFDESTNYSSDDAKTSDLKVIDRGKEVPNNEVNMIKLNSVEEKINIKMQALSKENRVMNKTIQNDIRRDLKTFRAETNLRFDSMDSKIDSLKDSMDGKFESLNQLMLSNRHRDIVIIGICAALIAFITYLNSN
jgi:hypothetical protein